MEASGEATKLTAKEKADAFLDSALKGRSTMIQSETNRLIDARANGVLSKRTSDEEITNYATKIGYHHQATSIVQAAPDTDALFYLRQQVMAQQHPNGATYTEQYGDMRSYGSGGASKQRADNTRLSNASALHDNTHHEDEDVERAIQESLREQERLYDAATMHPHPLFLLLL